MPTSAVLAKRLNTNLVGGAIDLFNGGIGRSVRSVFDPRLSLTRINPFDSNRPSMGRTHPISMTALTNTRSKRRIASVMLLFWLFALGAGWANACVLQERGTHAHSAEAIAAGSTTVSAGHVGVVDDHGVDSSPGHAPCLKVCDDTSQSLVKWSSGIDLSDLAMLPLVVAMPWPALDVALEVPRPARIKHSAHAGPPLRTIYSRLAL